MQVHSDIEQLPRIPHPVLTIGTFDGVHLGHQTIIRDMNTLARQHGGQSVLLTFHPHPRSVVQPSAGVELLSGLEERLGLLDRAGLDHVIVYPFTQEFSRMSALEYVRDLLVNTIGVKHLVVGYDHHFGRNREGNIQLLREYAELYEFEILEIQAQQLDEVNISSTKVRQALKVGDVSQAKLYLGRNYGLSATVVKGEGRGRQIGYPTANLLLDGAEKLIPAKGVYAVKVHGDDLSAAGMLNIGNKPTFHPDGEWPLSLEVYILDYASNIYGQQVHIEFIEHIRYEQAFSDAEALKAQLKKDESEVRALLL